MSEHPKDCSSCKYEDLDLYEEPCDRCLRSEVYTGWAPKSAHPSRAATSKQVGGDHYKISGVQPIEYIYANNLNFFEGSVVKYVTRWRNKGGIIDLEKAVHFLELLIELETKGSNA